MARHGETRSPSPVGSSYSSKRIRRDDDRYERSRRDDARSYRHRSRTRSPDVSNVETLFSRTFQLMLYSGDTEIEIHAVIETVQGTDVMLIPTVLVVESAHGIGKGLETVM